MKRLLKFGIWLLFACVFFIGLLLAFVQFAPSKIYAPYLQKIITDVAKENRVNVSVSDLKINLNGVQASEIETLIGLLPLKIEKPRVSVSPFSLFSRNKSFSASGLLYDGRLSANSSIDFQSGSGSGELSIDSINLVPLLGFFGTQQGQLSAALSRIQVDQNQIKSANFELNLKNMMSRLPPIPIRTGGTPLILTIKEIKDLNLDLKANYHDGLLQIESGSSESSLGKANLSGRYFTSSPTKDDLLELLLQVELTPAGIAAIGPSLPALSNNTLDPSTSKFNIEIRGKGDKPLLSFAPSK